MSLHDTSAEQIQHNIGRLANASQSDPSYWLHFLATVAALYHARDALILRRAHDEKIWTAALKYPQRSSNVTAQMTRLLQTANQAQKQQSAVEVRLENGLLLRVIPLPLAPASTTTSIIDDKQSVALLALWYQPEGRDPAVVAAALEQLLLMLPQRSAAHALAHRSAADQLDDGAIVTLMRGLFSEPRFMKLVYYLCNTLAADLKAERVSLGVMKGAKIVLTGVSQAADFERRAAVARAIAETMEEACDQERPIVYPSDRDGRVVDRAHQQFSESHGNRAVLTVPLPGRTRIFGALFIERSGDPLSTHDIELLDQMARGIGPYLQRADAADRPFPIRWGRALLRGAALILGPRQVVQKLAAISAIAGLIAISVIKIEYRVDAGAMLRSEDISIISAPFDGFLASVHTDLGEAVRRDQILAELDTRELLQEETIATADVTRYRREVEKARAQRELAAMRIALAQQAQAEASLQLVRFKLGNAQIRALRDGIVVEGDLKKELGSPVRQGDILLRVAGTEALYLELDVGQADIHLLDRDFIGEAALVGRPDQKIGFVIERIDPVARSRQSGNSFLAKAQLQGEYQNWWRPGMGGNAKIDAGERSILWIMTHRTLNFLREFFWL